MALRKPKVAVYSICKNESKFVEKYMASCKDADGVFILDTGSTDDTVARLLAAGANVATKTYNKFPGMPAGWQGWPEDKIRAFVAEHRDPRNNFFFFDSARNDNLAMIPLDYDICVCLDLDEVLLPGWRAALEVAYSPAVTCYRYEYIWNHKPDGTPDLIYWAGKIHDRLSNTWYHPLHEILKYVGPKPECMVPCTLKIEHFADNTKSRSNYLPMLEFAVAEDRDDDRNAHYLGRDYYFHQMFDQAESELKRHLSLPRAVWNAERAASMRYLGKIRAAKGDFTGRVLWYLRAVAEAHDWREPWVDLAEAFFESSDWTGLYWAAERALMIKERQRNYISQAFAWGPRPQELLDLARRKLAEREAIARATHALTGPVCHTDTPTHDDIAKAVATVNKVLAGKPDFSAHYKPELEGITGTTGPIGPCDPGLGQMRGKEGPSGDVPIISVFLPHKNRTTLAIKTVNHYQHLLCGCGVPYEIILADDASQQSEYDALERIALSSGGTVRLANAKPHAGANAVESYNAARAIARGSVFIVSCAEVLPIDRRFIDAAMGVQPGKYVVGACFALSPVGTLRTLLTPSERLTPLDFFQDGGEWYQHSQHRPACYNFFTLIHRDDWDKIGGFSEALRDSKGYEDNDFLAKVRAAGLQIVQDDTIHTVHLNHYGANYEGGFDQHRRW